MYCSCLLSCLWRQRFWNLAWLSYQAVFLHDQKFRTNIEIFQEQNELLRWNKNHFSSFWRTFSFRKLSHNSQCAYKAILIIIQNPITCLQWFSNRIKSGNLIFSKKLFKKDILPQSSNKSCIDFYVSFLFPSMFNFYSSIYI